MAKQDPLIIGRVVGDVIDPFNPCVKMSVIFNNKQVYNGHELFPSSVTSKPRVQVHDGDLKSFFTLIQMFQDLVILILENICTGTTDATFGKEIVSYELPRPNIGIHRFVFILFKQKGRGTVSPPCSRDGFCTKKFAEVNKLGPPVAAVYFNCQRETAARRR
ncbi:CEN-like protein 2 [Bienertia sinuspersici]